MKKDLRHFFAVLFLFCAIYHPASGQTFVIPAKTPLFDTGLDLLQGQHFTITAEGSWSPGGTGAQFIGPVGWTSSLLSNALCPFMPFGALIARIGNTTLLIGDHFSGSSPEQGRLFLSMNDAEDAFSDNIGQMNVVLTIRPYVYLQANPWTRFEANMPILFVPPAAIKNKVKQALGGGIVQLSQTGAGNILDIPQTDGTVIHSKSFIEFGPLLQFAGVKNIDIPLPDNTYDWDQLSGVTSGGVPDLGTYLLTHGTLIIDKFRFLLNNIHSNFDTDLSVALGNNEILLVIQMHAPDPAIRGEADAFFPLFGIIPIPIGWQDGLFPDIALNSMTITLHISPFVDDKNTIHLQNLRADVVAQLTVSIADFVFDDIKTKTVSSFENTLNTALQKDAIKTALETTISNLFMAISGKSNSNINSIGIDPTGMLLTWNN